MKRMILNVFAVAFMVLGLTGVASVSPAYASGTTGSGTGTGTGTGTTPTANCKPGELDCVTAGNDKDLIPTLNKIINAVVGVIGFVAVAMMVIGGISYATSQGDAAKTKKAQNTILYGVVGLVVAILAFAIVNFVLANIK